MLFREESLVVNTIMLGRGRARVWSGALRRRRGGVAPSGTRMLEEFLFGVVAVEEDRISFRTVELGYPGRGNKL